MTLNEAIYEAKITAVLYEQEARKCIQHGGSFYEEKAKAFMESAKEFEQVTEWLEELKAYREAHGKTDRPQGEWKPKNHHTDYCSNCGFEETQWRTADYNFCPSCGVRMKGVDDEHTV